MEVEWDGLAEYLKLLEPFIGDRRTARTVRGTIEGIIAGQTLRCTQIAAFSPTFSGSRSAYKRVRRLVHGETRKRSPLGEAQMRDALQQAGARRLAGAGEV